MSYFTDLLTDLVRMAIDIFCVWRIAPERSQNVYLRNSWKFKFLALGTSEEPRNIFSCQAQKSAKMLSALNP
jgi:hypothetical protein